MLVFQVANGKQSSNWRSWQIAFEEAEEWLKNPDDMEWNCTYLHHVADEVFNNYCRYNNFSMFYSLDNVTWYLPLAIYSIKLQEAGWAMKVQQLGYFALKRVGRTNRSVLLKPLFESFKSCMLLYNVQGIFNLKCEFDSPLSLGKMDCTLVWK